jgi:hypothetical protein
VEDETMENNNKSKKVSAQELLKNFKPKEGHKLPVTRRQFVAQGLLQGASLIALPTALEILVNQAHAATCASTDTLPTAPAFFQVNGGGGACYAWDFGPTDAGGQPLAAGAYANIGYNGATPTITPGIFANPVSRSPQGNLITSIQTALGGNAAAVLARTIAVQVCYTSQDDTDGGPQALLPGIVSNAGVSTKLKVLGARNNTTGIGHVEALGFEPVAPFVPSRISAVVGALGSATTGAYGVLAPTAKDRLMKMIQKISVSEATRLSKARSGQEAADLVECATGQNITLATAPPDGDPRPVAAVAAAWGISTATADTDRNGVRAAIAFNVIKGNASAGAFEVGGCDYHGQGVATVQARHAELGQIIGRTLGTAAALGRRTFIVLTSDGSVNFSGADPASDRGETGTAIIFMYVPNGQTLPTVTRRQVGFFNASGENAPGSPTNNVNMGMASIYANYLYFMGKNAAEIQSLIPSLAGQNVANYLAIA